MKKSWMTFFVCLLTVRGVLGADAPATEPKAPATTDRDSPEASYRAFMLAMLTGDREAIRDLTVPTNGLEILFEGAHVPPDEVENVRQAVEQRLVLRRVQPGEKFMLPKGKVVTIRDGEVNENRVLLAEQGVPVPTRCVKVRGRWRIDPQPIVDARRAAAEFRKRAEEKKRKSKETLTTKS